MIGLVERGGLLSSLLELLAAEFGDEVALKWDECQYTSQWRDRNLYN